MKYYVIVYKRNDGLIGWVSNKTRKKDGLVIYELTSEKFEAKMWASKKVAEKTLTKLVENEWYDGELSIEEVGVLC